MITQDVAPYLAASAVLLPHCKRLGKLELLHGCKGGCCLRLVSLLHLNSNLHHWSLTFMFASLECSHLFTLPSTTIINKLQAKGCQHLQTLKPADFVVASSRRQCTDEARERDAEYSCRVDDLVLCPPVAIHRYMRLQTHWLYDHTQTFSKMGPPSSAA